LFSLRQSVFHTTRLVDEVDGASIEREEFQALKV
jgi:hypothetical protein